MCFIKNSCARVMPTNHQLVWQHDNFLHPPQQRLLRPVRLQQENGPQIAAVCSLVIEDTAMCKEGPAPSSQ